jgi:Ca-activated chloride channel family protein
MFEFAWPWVFLLAALPWLLRRVLPVAESSEAALQVSFIDELQEISGRPGRSHLPPWRKWLPFGLIWLLLLLAAARPQWVGEPLPIPASGRDLMLAVDVSGSMEYADMRWQDEQISRLQLVKQLLGDFIDGRQGDRIGLILFGTQAYLQAPLTFDRQTVHTWLDEALIGIAGKSTAIGDAIGLAVKRLRQRPADSRVLVLVTDGANTAGEIEPLVAARLAAAQGVRIYSIGIGAEPGSDISSGTALELDEPMLQAIAGETGGEYFRARNADELQRIGASIDKLEPVAQQPTRTRATRALYPWPLAAALLLSLLLAADSLWPHLRRRLDKMRRPA